MKVLHLIGGELSGGAARGALALHEALIESGISSRILTNGKDTLGSPYITSVTKSLNGRFLHGLRSRADRLPQFLYPNRNTQAFSTGMFGFPFKSHPLYAWADIIHLHWINGALVSIRDLKGITKPLLWTMRDMWAFTGGCHVALDCVRYEVGCGMCPQLGSLTIGDLSRVVMGMKKRSIPRDITIVGISNWVSECARKSLLFAGAEIVTISNSISLREFVYQPRSVARGILGLPIDRRIILAGAERPDVYWKGFDLLHEALPLLREQQPLLLLFGNHNESPIANLGIEYRMLGMIRDREVLRSVYCAADVFVAPSRTESFGKTLVEAMACATPVVAFNATGPQDIVDHKINGYLAQPYSVEDLAYGIRWVLGHPDVDQLGQQAREKSGRFSSLLVAKSYIELYQRKLQRLV